MNARIEEALDIKPPCFRLKRNHFNKTASFYKHKNLVIMNHKNFVYVIKIIKIMKIRDKRMIQIIYCGKLSIC